MVKKSKKFKLGKIHLNFTNRSTYTFLSIIILVLGAVAIQGVWVPAAHPVSHDADNLKVSIGSPAVDYSLQEAIDDGLIGGGGDGVNLGSLQEDITFFGQNSRTIGMQSTDIDITGPALTIAAGTALGSGSSSADGGDLILTAGFGNAHVADTGGDVVINPGSGSNIGNVLLALARGRVGIGKVPTTMLDVAGTAKANIFIGGRSSGTFANGLISCDSIDFPSSTTFRCNNPHVDMLHVDQYYGASDGIQWFSGSSLNGGAVCIALGGVYLTNTAGSTTALATAYLWDEGGDTNSYVWGLVGAPQTKIGTVTCGYL